jgi:retinol-binding protein 3
MKGVEKSMKKDEIESICAKIIELVENHYVITSKKNKIINGVVKKMKDGCYDFFNSYDEFVTKFNNDLRELSGDNHLYLKSLQEGMQGYENKNNWLQAEKNDEIRFNFGFTEVKILPENVGYLKIEKFMNPDKGIETTIAAMKFIENTSSTIIDIRDNGGGYGGLAEYLISYFFHEEPTILSTTYFSDNGKITANQTFTHPFVIGKRRCNHNLYILINNKTASAAEYFAYTLQSNNKAIIIGEISAGGANRNTFFEINSELRISISTGYPIIEATKTNWEGTGVIPNKLCPSGDALNIALEEIKLISKGYSID